jgi:hypothetical protein
MTDDSKQATGRVIKAGHDCEMPADQIVGAVFRCDCGRYWQLRQTLSKPRWMFVGAVEAILRGWNKL